MKISASQSQTYQFQRLEILSELLLTKPRPFLKKERAINNREDKLQRRRYVEVTRVTSSTHLCAQCIGTTPVVTAGIPEQNSPSLQLQENRHCPTGYLAWTDRQTPTLNKSPGWPTVIPNFTAMQISHSICLQLWQVPKTGVPWLGAPARGRSSVALISNKPHWSRHLTTTLPLDRETTGLALPRGSCIL